MKTKKSLKIISSIIGGFVIMWIGAYMGVDIAGDEAERLAKQAQEQYNLLQAERAVTADLRSQIDSLTQIIVVLEKQAIND